MAMIKLENVNKNFGDLHVLKNVNLEVEEGEKLVIIGPSGSGKSTTVRCMNFLEVPSSGHVYINGTELTTKNKTKVVRDNTSMVFQQFNLYPHMTVLKNLTLAPTGELKIRNMNGQSLDVSAAFQKLQLANPEVLQNWTAVLVGSAGRPDRELKVAVHAGGRIVVYKPGMKVIFR